MKFVILTGMSGAGKSTALKMMEDIGFYCVDNLPIPLLEKFSELTELQQNAEASATKRREEPIRSQVQSAWTREYRRSGSGLPS